MTEWHWSFACRHPPPPDHRNPKRPAATPRLPATEPATPPAPSSIAYEVAGAAVAADAAEVFTPAEMIVAVREPQSEEIARLHEGQILFIFLL